MTKQFSYFLFTIALVLFFSSLTKAQVSNPGGVNDPSETGTFLKPFKVPKAKKLSKLKTAEEYFARAIESFNQGNLDLALLDYDEAIKKKPDYMEAFLERATVHMAKANAFLDKEERAKGFSDLREAIKLKPDSIEAHFNLGVAYYRENSFDDAITEFGQVLRIQPDYVDAFNNRAYAHRKKGNLEKALEDFNEAIRLKPDFAEAYLNIGLIYKNKGDKEKAIENFKTVVKLANVANAVRFAKEELVELGIEDDEYRE